MSCFGENCCHLLNGKYLHVWEKYFRNKGNERSTRIWDHLNSGKYECKTPDVKTNPGWAQEKYANTQPHWRRGAVASESDSVLQTVYDDGFIVDNFKQTDQANKRTSGPEKAKQKCCKLELEVWPKAQACSSSREVETNHTVTVVRTSKKKSAETTWTDAHASEASVFEPCSQLRKNKKCNGQNLTQKVDKN